MPNSSLKNIALNRRARFDYEISDIYEAGLELSGMEAKSARMGGMNLTGSHALVKNGEVWLLNSQIMPFQPKNAGNDYDPTRFRRLLLRRAEISVLTNRLEQKGWSLIALRAYLKKNLVKVELGLGRSKKAHDKRDSIKKKTIEREIGRVRAR
ncbi:MAG TPA: SsrA-binding protein SmpB [Candidatus Paceibacterota bacterium]